MRKVSLPSTSLVTCRVLNDLPSRTVSTTWVVWDPGLVGRKKYPWRECTSRPAGTVCIAAFNAWPTTMPPNTRPCTHHFGQVVTNVAFPSALRPEARAVRESTSSATVAGTSSASSASSSSTKGSAGRP